MCESAFLTPLPHVHRCARSFICAAVHMQLRMCNGARVATHVQRCTSRGGKVKLTETPLINGPYASLYPRRINNSDRHSTGLASVVDLVSCSSGQTVSHRSPARRRRCRRRPFAAVLRTPGIGSWADTFLPSNSQILGSADPHRVHRLTCVCVCRYVCKCMYVCMCVGVYVCVCRRRARILLRRFTKLANYNYYSDVRLLAFQTRYSKKRRRPPPMYHGYDPDIDNTTSSRSAVTIYR